AKAGGFEDGSCISLHPHRGSRCRPALRLAWRALSPRPGPKNVPGCVQISVCRMSARPALEERLALAVLLRDIAALGARLTGECGRDRYKRPAALLKLVRKQRLEPMPALVQDAAIEASLLRNVAARLLGAAGRARCHVPRLEVFDDYRSETPRDPGRNFVELIVAGVRHRHMNAADARLLPTPAVRSFASTGKAPLRIPEAPQMLAQGVDRLDHFP